MGALDLDLGYLALFVGMRINELVLEQAHASGYGDIRQSHGYVFQHLVEGPKQVSELATLLGVSQQAASKAVAELVDLGYLERTVADDRRAREVALSDKARRAIAETRKSRAAIERRLVGTRGAEIARAKRLLASVLEDLGGADTVRARRVRAPR